MCYGVIGRVRESRNPKKVIRVSLMESYGEIGRVPVNLLGIVLCAISIMFFAFPNAEGLNINGIYQFSRNPMYVAYFICFIGMSLLTQSLILLGIVIIFQVSAHWIILSEERWCIKRFGKSYEEYMKKVHRYI